MAAPDASRLDANQVLKASFNEDTGRLRTESDATVINADIDVALDATEDNVAIADPAGDFLDINPDGSINVSSVDGALESTQQQVLAELQDFHSDNTSENAAELAELQSFHADNSAENAAELAELQSFHSDNSSENAQIITELQSANSSLDAIESDTDLIRIAVQSIDTDFDVALSTRATEATQLANNSELQAINAELDTQTIELQAINSSLDAIEADTDLIRIAVQSIDADFDVTLSSRASEATQLANNSELQDINSELDSQTAELVAANSSLDAIEADTDLIRIAVQSIDSDFDVALSTRATEATQLQVLAELQDFHADNTAENTQIITELQAANSSLDAIESDADAIRIATQSIDTDFDVALSTRASEATQLDVLSAIEVNNNLYSRILPLLQNANFLKQANFDNIDQTYLGNTATLSYKEDTFEIATVEVEFLSPTDWNIAILRYILDDDGSKLLDDNDTELNLE